MQLSQINTRLWKPGLHRWLAAGVMLVAAAFYITHMAWRHSLSSPPAVTGDSPDYDSIAWELSQGRGFLRNFADDEFRRPYLDHDTQTVFPGSLPPVAHPATDRPPLYPALLAGQYQAFGRQFWSIRITQGLLMGIVAGLAASLACRSAGPVPALLAAFGFVIVDWRTRWSTREVLTESLACLCVTLLILALVALLRQPSALKGLLCGIVWGLAILTRTMFVLWGPVLLLLIYASRERRRNPKVHQAAAVMIASTLILCGPWWIRNCLVLDALMPLGTQGREQLSAAYSDEAFRRAGMWFNLDQTGFFDSLDLPSDDPLAAAKQRAEFSGARAREWMATHPFKTILLIPLRVLQEFRPHGPGELAILMFALLGLAVLFSRPEGQVIAALLVAQTLAVSLTWSVSGRFLIPLLGGLHAAAAVGLWAAYVLLVERRAGARQLLNVTEPAATDAPAARRQRESFAQPVVPQQPEPAQPEVAAPIDHPAAAHAPPRRLG